MTGSSGRTGFSQSAQRSSGQAFDPFAVKARKLEPCVPADDVAAARESFITALDDEWRWDPAADASSPVITSDGKFPKENHAHEAADFPAKAARSEAAPTDTNSEAAAEDWRQTLWLHLESAPRPLSPWALLQTLGKPVFDRELLLALSALARSRGRTDDVAAMLDRALDDPKICCGYVRMAACIASMLYTRALMAPAGAAVLRKAMLRFPSDRRLENRELFVSLRSADFSQAISIFQKRIEAARQRGDRKTAARLNLILGHLYENRLADHFRSAECLARAAALYMAIGRPKDTYRAQSAAVAALSQVMPPPRQLTLAVRALKTTAKAAGRTAEANALIASLQLAAASSESFPVQKTPKKFRSSVKARLSSSADAEHSSSSGKIKQEAEERIPVSGGLQDQQKQSALPEEKNSASGSADFEETKTKQPLNLDAQPFAASEAIESPEQTSSKDSSPEDVFDLAAQNSGPAGIFVNHSLAEQATMPIKIPTELTLEEHSSSAGTCSNSAACAAGTEGSPQPEAPHSSAVSSNSEKPEASAAGRLSDREHILSLIAFSAENGLFESLGSAVKNERKKLLHNALESPFSPASYKELAGFFIKTGRQGRAKAAADIAAALSGDVSLIETSPAKTLSDEDWSEVMHPALNRCAAELGSIIGPAVCETISRNTGSFPVRGPFTMDGSDGAWSMADALLSSVRVLGLRSGAIHLWKEGDREPISIIPTWPPALCVSKPLLKAGLSAPCLRFFAGRALSVMRSELQMYLLADPELITEIFKGLTDILNHRDCSSTLVGDVVRKTSGKAARRLKWLLKIFWEDGISAADFCRASRYTADRLGYLVSGNIAEALKSLEFSSAPEDERAALLEFAVSESCQRLRSRT